MKKGKSFSFNDSERLLILKALLRLNRGDKSEADKIERLVAKMADDGATPGITVGVHGGQVQWVMGNPFPIRICDYDGEREDLPDVDERGQQCRIWFEPADNAVQSWRVSR
jgi:hypothetical protein